MVAAALASLGLSVAAVAPAANAATAPQLDVATLEAALDAVPGVNTQAVQALVSDLTTLQSGGTTPAGLASDLESVVSSLTPASGVSSALQPVMNLTAGLLGGGGGGASGLGQVIEQLQAAASAAGVSPAVESALSQLASSLTTADLGGLLGQAGSPLGSSAIQTILGELGALENLPADAQIPAGLLSGIAGALQEVASQPGVPATTAAALNTVAGTLGATNAIPASTLTSALPTLESAIPSLQSVPDGQALGSLVDTLTTGLTATPPAGGGTGGVGALGGNGGTGSSQPGTSTSTSTTTYITTPGASQTASAPSTAASAKLGASIRSLSFAHGRLHVVLGCPAALTQGCRTTIHLSVGPWHFMGKTVAIKAGKSTTVVTGLPHIATVAAEHGRELTVTATTGPHTTNPHRIRIDLKA